MKAATTSLFMPALLCLLAWLPLQAAPLTEAQKIDALLHAVEVLPGAQFIRNGSSYDGRAAADHLRLKLRNAGGRVKTAEQFINYIATGSSWSGQPYHIRFADGRTVTSAEFFRAELKKLETPPKAVPAAAPASRSGSGSNAGSGAR
ncbi:MAG: DUF5329 domain-containing protein [Proteobacteria bacterium]|nr:DUF5329 domain-containing protein [Pseudomonadota bacterium]